MPKLYSLLKLDSLHKKFIFFVSVSIIIVMLVYSALNIYISNISNEKELLSRSTYISDLSAQSLIIPLWNYDGDAVRGIGKALHNDTNILYIDIVDYHNDISVYQSADLPSEANTHFVQKNIVRNDAKLGHITIGFDRSYLKNELYRLVLIGLIQTFALIILLTFVVRRVSLFVTKPLEALSSITTEFAEGNFEARADIHSNDEVTILAHDFNYMAEKIMHHIEETEYLGAHDSLTGLFNRYYFDQHFKAYSENHNKPFTIIIGDLNGLKMANDVFGHEFGDEILVAFADLLKDIFKDHGTPIRWGGDEFIVLLPQTNHIEAAIYRKEIKIGCDNITFDKPGFSKLSVAIGHDTKIGDHQGLMEILKNAEDIMYREKLLESKSVHSTIMDYLKNTLNERSKETFEHAERLWELGYVIAQELEVSNDELNQLKLFSSLHDLGKIAIPDALLLKPGPLNAEEWEEMKKHSEIGYRLALTSPELVSIADLILSHHERWDGTGYPQGLAGEKIPLLARILSIADAYDAMTEERPYKKPLSKLEALKEIRVNSRKQFDPKLAEIFMRKMTEL